MAVYNTAPYLNAALASITSQTFQNFELVVLDDGSTDGSLEVLRAYLAVVPRMRLISRPNRGIIATRNELLESASAELVAWMDSDDISVPCRLALQVAAFDVDQALVCISGTVQCIDPNGNFLNVERYPLEHSSILIAWRFLGVSFYCDTSFHRDSRYLSQHLFLTALLMSYAGRTLKRAGRNGKSLPSSSSPIRMQTRGGL